MNLNPDVEKKAIDPTGSGLWNLALGLLFLVPLVSHLAVEWRINPQYSHGWGALALAAYLFFKRWESRPQACPTSFRRNCFHLTNGCLLLFLGCILIFEESNPDWRPLSWLHLSMVIGFWLIGLERIGGRGWVSHFAFPLGFLFITTPWPTPVEKWLILKLTSFVASMVVEVLQWLGHPAVQQGNLIHVGGGIVGVDEACSGIRSFQGTLMASLFFGELHRFGRIRRFSLLGLGAFLAIFLNSIRTLSLAMLHIQHGDKGVDRWHDSAGLVVLLLAFAGIGFGAHWMKKSNRTHNEIQHSEKLVTGERFLLRGEALKYIGTLLLVHVGVEGYYRSSEAGVRPKQGWEMRWPQADPGFRFTEVDERTRLLLRSDQAISGIWNRRDGSQWHLFFLRWKAGRTAANLAHAHSPEVCLPASGLSLLNTSPSITIEMDGMRLPFGVYTFDFKGNPMHVFFCVWHDRERLGSEVPGVMDQTRWGRLQAVLERRRHLGQRTMEIAIVGHKTLSLATEEFIKAVPNLIEPVMLSD